MASNNEEGSRIMSSIDTYHPISGLKNKLLGYFEFLKKCPSFRKKITLV